MRTSLLLLTSVLTVFPIANGPAQLKPATDEAPTSAVIDTAAARVHSQMIRAMGGEGAWKKARYFEFDFVVVREGKEVARWRHHWDRWQGDYRMSGVRGADTIFAQFNINDPKAGRVTVNGAAQQGARRDSLLTFAYARHINDSYWLIMPYKWLDPGVTLTYQGMQTDSAGKHWEVVKLTFAEVGLTPQNQYLAFVNPQTWLMERWYHYPKEGAQPLRFDWKNWQKFGPIMLATDKPSLDNASVIRFDNVRVLTAVPRGAFE